MRFPEWEVVGIGEWLGRLSKFLFLFLLSFGCHSFVFCGYNPPIKDAVLLIFCSQCS